MIDLVGQTLRDYEIQAKIGSGGYGAVYRALQTTVQREVAIKTILSEHASKPEFARRFEAEARLVARLEHPHIVPLYDYWQSEAGAFLVMRWLPGGSLGQLLKAQGALSTSQTGHILSQIAGALAVAHQLGIIHRDLKPDNILLDERANAYLSDFGIAKVLDAKINITQTDAIVGTIAYMPPELLTKQAVLPQSDIYSLGLVLYEMLAGEHPFGTPPLGTMVMKQLQEPVPDICIKCPDLPPEINDIIQKATQKDPLDRYTDALVMAREFNEYTNTGSRTPIVFITQVASALRTAATARLRTNPLTPEERNRRHMLQNVHDFWIKGILENTILIELGIRQQQNAVHDSNPDVVIKTQGFDDTILASHTEIIDVFDTFNGKLLILGEPGGGKTTTLLKLARDLLDRAGIHPEQPIPVVFNLSSWAAEQKPFDAWLIQELRVRYQVPLRTAEGWIKDDDLLLLLDGLDEINETARDAFVRALNTYREHHSFVDVVVCSRTSDYQDLTQQLALNGAIVLQSLTDEQVHRYLIDLGADLQGLLTLLQKDEVLQELSRSPLMLNIMTLVFRGAENRDLPSLALNETRREQLFRIYVQRMFERRIDNKLYSEQTTQHYLSWLAQQMQKHGQTVFTLEVLQPTWLEQDGSRMSYALLVGLIHTALFALIVTIGFLLIVALAWVIMHDKVEALDLAYGLTYGLALSPLAGVVGVVRAWTRKIEPVDVLVWSREATVKAIPHSMRYGLIFGIMVGLFLWASAGPVDGVISAVAGFLALSLALSLSSGFVSGQISTTIQPNEGIRRSALNALRITRIFSFAGVFILAPVYLIGYGIAYQFGYAFLDGMADGLAFGTAFGLAFGPINRGTEFIVQHFVLRQMLYLNGKMPQRLTNFLNYTTSLILMRRIGGGYIFLHRSLLEYFSKA